MLTPRRWAMVWPGTRSARDLGTISWRMNAVCEPLDHDSCQPSEDQWRKRNKDLGCLSQWERSKIAGWVKEHPTGAEKWSTAGREKTYLRKRARFGGAQVSPDAGRESTRRPSSPAQRITIQEVSPRTSTQECYPIVHLHQTYLRIPVVSTPEW